MILFYALLSLFLRIARSQEPGQWNFPTDGMAEVQIIVHTLPLCRAEIGDRSLIGSLYGYPITLNVQLPPGEFPLTILCRFAAGTRGAVRASVFINGKLDVWNSTTSPEWTAKSTTVYNPGVPQNMSCPIGWTNNQNNRYVTAGGNLNSISAWPCIQGADTYWFFTRWISIPKQSATSRKVTIGVAADDEIVAGSIGPFSFVKGEHWESSLYFSVYLEPGVYPFMAALYNSNAGSYFASVIAVDNVIVSKTGDAGWEGTSSTAPISSNMVAMTKVCGYTLMHWINQFQAEMKATPKAIWPNIDQCIDDAVVGMAFVRYRLDLKPRESPELFTKVDFHCAADSQFAAGVALARGSFKNPLITSFPDNARFNFFSYQLPVQYSYYLRAGTYLLRYSIASYRNGTVNPAMIIGAMSINGTFVTSASQESLRYCSRRSIWDAVRNEIAAPFPNESIESVWVNSECTSTGGVNDYFFRLNVYVSSNSTIVFASGSSSALPAATSTPVISRLTSSIITSSLFTLRSTSLSSEILRRASPNSVEYPVYSEAASPSFSKSYFEMAFDPLKSEEPSMQESLTRISKAIPTTSNFAKLPANANVVETIVLGLPILLWALLACLLVVLFCAGYICHKFKSRTTRPKSSSANKAESDYSDFFYTTSTDCSTTDTKTWANQGEYVFSIPGFLQVSDIEDFRIERSIVKGGGGGDVYIGRAFKDSLSAYGSRIIIKEIKDTTLERFQQELAITYSMAECPHIVRLLGYTSEPMRLILKYYPSGSLKKWLKSNRLTVSVQIKILTDVFVAVRYIHNKGIVHADLKSDNILIETNSYDSKVSAVITDFGIAQITGDMKMQVSAMVIANRIGFSRIYGAPEVIIDFKKNKVFRYYPSDVYALGVIVCELLNGGKLEF